MTMRTVNELAQYLSCAIEGDATVPVRERSQPGAGRAKTTWSIWIRRGTWKGFSVLPARCVITSVGLRVA